MLRTVGVTVAGAAILSALLLVGGPRPSAAQAADITAVESAPESVLPETFATSLGENSDVSESVVVRPAAAQADIAMSHVWQTLNNCGPASVTMLLSTLGISASQETARLALRGTNLARGMGPQVVDPWVNKLYGVRAFSRNNGSLATIKTLVTNGFAPMVTQWLYDPPSRVSHWRVVRGYSEADGVFYVADPMRGKEVPLTYQWFEDNWRPFQFRYLVLYRPENEGLLRAILKDEWFDVPSRFNYLSRARGEAAKIGSSEAWLSYGEAAYQTGRLEEAVAAFEKGMAIGSATGVFNVRSSYPTALRLLGRDKESRDAQAKLTVNSTPNPTFPDPSEVRLIELAGGIPSLLYPALAPAATPPTRVDAPLVPQL